MLEKVKLWFGYGWAQQPVTNRGWAFLASLLFVISQATGHRWGNHWKHVAWCKAGGRSWATTS